MHNAHVARCMQIFAQSAPGLGQIHRRFDRTLKLTDNIKRFSGGMLISVYSVNWIRVFDSQLFTRTINGITVEP